MIFTREKFERFASKSPNGWRDEAILLGKLTDWQFEINDKDFNALQHKFKSPKVQFGLGDAVAALASPVAAASDKMFGTSLSSCGGCAKRREALNQMVPNILPPLSP
jgi:hypothetical protein